MILTSQQQSALNDIVSFINSTNPEDKVFILAGYAGTGKTTIIKEILRSCRSDEVNGILLMAPTGKAAKVLRERTGYKEACTIHSGIFSQDPIFVNQEDNDVATTEVTLAFPLNTTKAHDSSWLCIIDEASMVSSREVVNEDLIFGTGNMLADILSFVDINSKSKVIFIGDPAQLPPVGDSTSNALNPEWFITNGYSPKHAVLTDVVRQGKDSIILNNSLKIRKLLEEEKRNELQFETRTDEVEDMGTEKLVDTFLDNWLNGYKGAIITFSNSSAYSFNLRIREKLGYSHSILTKGDALMVVHNNFFEGTAFYNGDNVEVYDVSPNIETFNIKLKKKIHDAVSEVTVTLEFREATIITEYGEKTTRKFLTNLLNSNKASLTPDEQRALYVHVCMRNPGIKDKTEITKILRGDAYYNALRVKYGYSVTCHKAQGSEWTIGYIDYASRRGFSDDALRWMYTATTRAKEKIFGVGIPNVTPISKLDVDMSIKPLTKTPDGFYPKGADVPETPFHKSSVMAPIKMKYWLTSEALSEKGYNISEVQSASWRESYFIDGCRYDATYNGQGVFKRFIPVENYSEEVLDILNQTGKISFPFEYCPEEKHLNVLHQHFNCLCEKYGIGISNVIKTTAYCVRYYLITETFEYAFIDLWFNANNLWTRAIASSSLGDNDKLLKYLLQEL